MGGGNFCSCCCKSFKGQEKCLENSFVAPLGQEGWWFVCFFLESLHFWEEVFGRVKGIYVHN